MKLYSDNPLNNILSHRQISQWSNTLDGQRKAKLEAKKKREEKDEEQR